MTEPTDASEGWEEVEGGLRRDEMGVFVSEVRIQQLGEPERRAYEVRVRRRMGTSAHTIDSIATFADGQTAWAFANLLTHYFDRHQDPPQMAVSGLTSNIPRYGHEVPDDAPELPTIVEELTAREALEMAARPGWVPNDVAELFP